MPAVLSDLERKILDYMVQYLKSNTYQPSIREIGEEFGIKSTKTVSEHLRALADKGYLERDPSRSRGVRILGVDLSPQTVSVPCFTTLPDAATRMASDGVEAYYSVDRRMAGAKGSYFVRVRGAGFAGLGLREGDFALVEPSIPDEVRDGDLAVIRRGEGPGLYRMARNGAGVTLEGPQLGDGPVHIDDASTLNVTGRVVAVYRRLDDAAIPLSPTAH